MMKRILIALALLGLAAAPALAQGTPKSKTALATEINTNFPDNVIGQITPAILRTTTLDMLASWQQYSSVNAQTAANYTVTASDYGQLITVTNAGAIAVTLPQATGSFATFSFFIQNIGATTATVTPVTSTINGAANLTVLPNLAFYIISDGTNWRAVPFGGGSLANPTQVIGLTAVPGVATTGMRSDAAPALSQAIVPTWTGAHTFTGGVSINSLTLTGITGATRCLHVDATGLVSGTASDCGSSSGGITAITSTGGTLTVTGSSTTNIEINLAHANTWTALQNITVNNNANSINVLTNTNTGNAAFTAWGVNNVVTNTYLGMTSAAYSAIPLLTGRGFILTDSGAAFIINTFTAAPVMIAVGNVETARFQTSGGLSIGNANVAIDGGSGGFVAAAVRASKDCTNITGGCLPLIVTGATNPNQQLYLGYDTTNNRGFIQAALQGTAYEPLQLNPSGGAVQIGSGGLTLSAPSTGTLALATGAIASGACTAAQTAASTGLATTDTIIATFSADPTGTTGYAPSTNGMLTIIPWATANTVNFKVCNNTAASITPGAVSINWRVVH